MIENGSTPHIYWIYKDAIDLTSRRKVRFRETFFQNEVRKVLLFAGVGHRHFDHSGRIYNPSNFGIIQKPTK